MYKGIDVSTFQGYPDWTAVRQDFAIIKAGQGRAESTRDTFFTDSKFRYNITNCRCPYIGVYYYLTAVTVADAELEAAHYLRIIEPYRARINLYAAVDVESVYIKRLPRDLLTAIVRRFYRMVEAAGYCCIVYTNPDFLSFRLNPMTDLRLWLAAWRKVKPEYGQLIWQYDVGRVAGIDRKTDLDYGYFDDTAPVKPSESTVGADRDRIVAGSTVRVENPIIYGTHRTFKRLYETYTVISRSGDRVVIGRGGRVTAAVDVDYLELV